MAGQGENLALIKGCKLKWLIIIGNSWILSTLNTAVVSLFFLTFPTPKVFLIDSSNSISLICTLIAKLGVTLHFNLDFSSLYIEIKKLLSASENPVINQGLSLEGLDRIENVFNLWLERVLT